jgi:hypothetical protein
MKVKIISFFSPEINIKQINILWSEGRFLKNIKPGGTTRF